MNAMTKPFLKTLCLGFSKWGSSSSDSPCRVRILAPFDFILKLIDSETSQNRYDSETEKFSARPG